MVSPPPPTAPAKAKDLRRMQINQAIEKRGGLRFRYPAFADRPRESVRWLPFTENPTITESRKANYASKKIFLRNEPVRLYTGSEARKFKVDIHYSLIHLAAMMPTKEILRIFSQEDANFLVEFSELIRYLESMLEQDLGENAQLNGAALFEPLEKNYINEGFTNFAKTLVNNLHSRASNVSTGYDLASEVKSRLADGSEGPFGQIPSNPESIINAYLVYLLRTNDRRKYTAALLQYAINHIRNSVISTSETPVKGPPIVELKWGSLYNFTPCVVTNYQINAVETAGYDTKSLYPQRLKISLTMEEMRNVHGQLQGDPKITGDLPGWDKVMNSNFVLRGEARHRTLDPHYYDGRRL